MSLIHEALILARIYDTTTRVLQISQALFSIPHLLLSEPSGVTVIRIPRHSQPWSLQHEYSSQGVSSVVPQFSPFPRTSNSYPNSGASRRPTEPPLILPYAKFMTASRYQMSEAHNTWVVETRQDYQMLGIGFKTDYSFPRHFLCQSSEFLRSCSAQPGTLSSLQIVGVKTC